MNGMLLRWFRRRKIIFLSMGDPVIEVINMHQCHDFGKPGDFRCDRETKWGNPFIMYETRMRDRVCDLYETYLDFAIIPGEEATVRKLLTVGNLTPTQVNMWMEKMNGHLDINELKGAKRLFCWCAPSRCHCHYLAKTIENITTNQEVLNV